MADKIPLSVAIITKNEEENLPDCLRSVAFARQIVVVDSGSTDNTIRIATDCGCDVYSEGWRGFGPQKQLAIDRCEHPWILVLDADERIPPETEAKIREIISSSPSVANGYSFPRKNFFKGRWIRHAGWWPDRITRLFKKNYGKMSKAAVHEAVEISGPVVDLDVSLIHLTESRLSDILIKIDRYSTLGAQESYAAGKRSTVWYAFLRAGFVFVQNYFLRLGMLDGSQGLTLAVTDSVNKFFKYAKLSELVRKTRRKA